ncbi:MAG: hypothetical protein RTV41_08035 [Candidatus Thorarchaeota archaeon]
MPNRQRTIGFDKRVIIGLTLVFLMLSPFALSVNDQIQYVGDHLLLPSKENIVSADVPTVNLTYTSRTLLTNTQVHSGDTIAGDHVTLKTTWQPEVNNSRIEVHAPAIPSILITEENETTLELDTRFLGNNATCTIIASTMLSNGTVWSEEFTDVYIGNFFVPQVQVDTPNGGEDWTSLHNITWTASDVNVDDILLFDVLFSDDSGESFTVLVESTTKLWFEWDCSGLNMGDNYSVEVRVTDGIYFNSDISDAEFSAGTVFTTTTPPPSTTTTTSIPPLDSRIAVFVAILLFSSGIMALVVYYAARKWF